MTQGSRWRRACPRLLVLGPVCRGHMSRLTTQARPGCDHIRVAGTGMTSWSGHGLPLAAVAGTKDTLAFPTPAPPGPAEPAFKPRVDAGFHATRPALALAAGRARRVRPQAGGLPCAEGGRGVALRAGPPRPQHHREAVGETAPAC